MLDRLVVQLEPEPKQTENTWPFSSFAGIPNLIVLGDPGAGKTELFRQFADAAGERFMTVRQFLTTPAERISDERVLWIDALDETRSGRGDKSTIDDLIEKLYAVGPQRVRLSCRVADWLGKSDLRALAPYFESNGGAPTVVQLQPLTREEQRQILLAKDRAEPDRFLDEAERRGLGAMLSNPQTLLMLNTAVRDRDWPATRHALFEKAVAILLGEHNDEHSERRDAVAQQTSVALKTAAGALCALRLVSDCEGFSLRPNGPDEKTPGYRDIPLAPPEAIEAALTRRVFVSTGEPNIVDYLHRTIAEYLGACWLAEKIVGGLPLGRVQALLGVDGYPASSLRGLHAWLAVLSPDSASAMIDADPMGVVMYADAAKLGPGHKTRLLKALSLHAERDPWFYRGAYAAYGIGALSDPCMTDAFRDVLLDNAAPFGLRRLVADAQAKGTPLLSLREDMQAILMDANEPFGLRDACLDALIALGDAGKEAALAAYASLGDDESDLRLRADMIREWYGQGLAADDFLGFVSAMLSVRPDLTIGTAYALDRKVPVEDAADLLDGLDFTGIMPEHGFSLRKTYDLVRVYEGVFVKALQARPLPSSQRLYVWLRVLMRYATRHQLHGDLVKTVASDDLLADALLDAWIEHCEIDDRRNGGWFTFQRVFVGYFNEAQMMSRMLAWLSKVDAKKACFFYGRVLSQCLSAPEQYDDLFWAVYRIADVDDRFVPVRDWHCVCTVDDIQLENSEIIRSQEEERVRSRKEALAHFDAHRDQIVSGEHLGWIGSIADHYFERWDVDDRQLDPIPRLQAFLGPERTEAALAGLRALVAQRKAPALSEMLALKVKNENNPSWWLGVLAGLDLLSEQQIEETSFAGEYLQSAIAIACFWPVYRQQGNTIESWNHRWLDAAIRDRPGLVRETYAAIIEAGLARGLRSPEGMDEFKESALSGPERGALIVGLLSRFPQMHSDALESFLWMAKDDGAWSQFSHATAAGVAAEITQDDEKRRDREDTRRLWLAFGFLTEPERYRQQIETLDDDAAKAMVWPLLRAGSLDRHRDSDFGRYSVEQLEFVAIYAARFHPDTPSPTGVIHGRENPWDVSFAIGNILAALAASEDDAARDALQRLSVHPALETYTHQARHALAEQHIRRIDAAYAPCDWRSAAQTLENRAPSSIHDLHALVLDQLDAIARRIAHGNTDTYTQFWNVDPHGRVVDPKPEESARHALIDMLRPRLYPLGISVEPEGHMARDKRADIVVQAPGMKCLIELKRDYHAEVWTAAEDQLERWYARDPEASGYGIYGVFWYGSFEGRSIPKPPDGGSKPRSVIDMQRRLEASLPEDKRRRIRVKVIDVSGDTDSPHRR